MVKHRMLVVVHPWDNARLASKWNLLGRGHVDGAYEHHVRCVLKPFIQQCRSEGMPVAYYLGLREFRIHPAIEGLRDFVIYDGDDWAGPIYAKDGIESLIIAGYAENL